MVLRASLLIVLLTFVQNALAAAPRILFLLRQDPPGGSADQSVKTHLETMSASRRTE